MYRYTQSLLNSFACGRSICFKYCLKLINLKLQEQSYSTVKLSWGIKKPHRKVKLNLYAKEMNPEAEKLLAPLRASVKEQVS